MYSLEDHGRMVSDPVRMGAYAQALRGAVRPGGTVLDIGTGVGVFALLAAQLGARRVYAVEPSDAIHVAERIARDNGYADRIRFLGASSFDVQLPERVDLIVSDLHGVLPLFGRHIPTILDARLRFLAAGGSLIPRRETLWAALVGLPDWYERHIGGVGDLTPGLDWGLLRRTLANSTYRVKFGAEAVLTEPRCWGEIDYALVECADVEARLVWTADGPGRADGIGLWFDSELDAETTLSTRPGVPDSIYGRLVLPFLEPLDLLAGDAIQVALRVKLVGDEYLWRWDTQVYAGGDAARVRARHAQSTFYATLLSPQQLKTQADEYRPSLTEEGEWTGFVLAAIAAGKALGAIAGEASARYPGRFQDLDAARLAVRSVAQQFAR